MADNTFTGDDIKHMDRVYRLKLINSLSGFKSVNLIGTVGKEGQENLAIFSSVVHVGSDPPLLGCVMRPVTVPRHSYQNIKETGWYTINHVSQAIYKKAHETSGKYRRDLSEFEQCGLNAIYTENCPAPYVEEASIRIGMKLEEEHMVEANGTIFLVGSIRELQLLEKSLRSDGSLDIEAAGTVALSGLGTYHATQKLDRLPYVRVEENLKRED